MLMRRSRIFYAPGFIGLLGLLGLFLFFKPAEPTPLIYQRPSRIFLPYDQEQLKHRSGQTRFTEKWVLQQMKGKKLIEIDLDDDELEFGDTGITHEKKRFIVREFQRMQFTGDTMSILKVDLGRGNSFGDFMWIQKLAQDYHVHRYAFMDDSFIFFANPFRRSFYLSLSP